jgi:hypothetical protein
VLALTYKDDYPRIIISLLVLSLARGLNPSPGETRLIATSPVSPARGTRGSSQILAIARQASLGEQRIALDRLRRLLGHEAAAPRRSQAERCVCGWAGGNASV